MSITRDQVDLYINQLKLINSNSIVSMREMVSLMTLQDDLSVKAFSVEEMKAIDAHLDSIFKNLSVFETMKNELINKIDGFYKNEPGRSHLMNQQCGLHRELLAFINRTLEELSQRMKNAEADPRRLSEPFIRIKAFLSLIQSSRLLDAEKSKFEEARDKSVASLLNYLIPWSAQEKEPSEQVKALFTEHSEMLVTQLNYLKEERASLLKNINNYREHPVHRSYQRFELRQELLHALDHSLEVIREYLNQVKASKQWDSKWLESARSLLSPKTGITGLADRYNRSSLFSGGGLENLHSLLEREFDYTSPDLMPSP